MADFNYIKTRLKAAVDQKKREKDDADFKSITSDLVKEISSSVSPDDVSNAVIDRLEKSIAPVLERLIEKDRVSSEDIKAAVSQIRVESPGIDVSPIAEALTQAFSSFSIPQPRVNVTVPPFPKIPDIKMPEEMSIKGWIGVMGYDKGLLNNPIPVQIRDRDGKPVSFDFNQVIQSGGGGKHDFFTIKGFSQSAYSELTNADGRLKVSVETGTSGLTDTELRATAVPVSQVSGASFSVYIQGAGATVGVVTIDPDGNPTYASATSGLTDSELRASSVPVAQASGAMWSTAVIDIFGSTAASSVFNADNRIKVSVETGGSGLTDSELRATAVPVSQVSGAEWSVSATNLDIRDLVNASDSVSAYQVSGHNWSVYAQDALTTVTATTIVNADNRIRVSLETGGSGLTDSELRATAVPVSQVSGAAWSTEVTNTVTVSGSLSSTGAYLLNGDGTYRGTLPVEATNLDIRDLVNASDSVAAYQVSGANWSVSVTGMPASTAASIVDSSGVGYSGSNPVPVTLATGLDYTLDSISAFQVSGANFSVQVTGSTGTTVVVGDDLADVADTGGAPVKMGGIARTANPTAVAAGDRVSATFDDLGRQIFMPVNVRDLRVTAYASLTTGTETTLAAAVAGSYLDLIYVMGANNSDAAVTVDIRPVTAGNIVMTLQIPANGTAGIACPVPLPQSDTGNNWTADMGDITGTTVYLTGLFSKEI